MKITKVEPLLLDRFLYVRVHTDAGITGLGEFGTWGQLEASAASIAKYGEYLVGKDPFPIEHHWNVMLRANHFTGGAITGAVSAIDIALWDIKGKCLQRAGLRVARRQDAAQGAALRPREGPHDRDAAGGGGAAEGGRLHRARAPQSVARRGRDHALLQIARRQDRGGDRQCPPPARGGRAEGRSLHRDPPPPDAAGSDRARAGDREIHADVLRGPAAPEQFRRHGAGGASTSTSRSPPASASPACTSSRRC